MPGARQGIGRRIIGGVGTSKIWVFENSILSSSCLAGKWEITIIVTLMF